MAEPILSIIIVSYNTKVLTAQTIESVLATRADTAIEVVVVDNASRDGSPEYLEHRYGQKIQLIKRKTNGGFAVANNEGILISRGKYILLLNSDTIVHPRAIQQMVDALEENPRFGIISCRLLYPDGRFQPQGGALPTLLNLSAWWLWPFPGQIPFVSAYQNSNEILREGQQNVLIERGWVGGTAMMIRRAVIEQIGGLDEKIFMYAEDVEYCARAFAVGWETGILPSSEITHIGSASSSSYRARLGEIRGLLYLFAKHKSLVETVVLRVVFFIGAVLRYVLFGILYGKVEARKLYAETARISRTGKV